MSDETANRPRLSIWLAMIMPGLLTAATGVGAGDLATAGLVGSRLGLTILWAVPVGAFLKFVLTEGLTRWQLATNMTVLEGAMAQWRGAVRLLFPLYLIPWSFFVGSALISACGVTMQAILPLFDNPVHGKIVYGILQSLLGLFLVRLGGFKLFEKVMAVCIGVMFVTVVITAAMVAPDWGEVMAGTLLPRVPEAEGAIRHTIALMGGVGGTLTILCYGYWIREEKRQGIEQLRTCRIDIAVGYAATALFGLAMVILGNQIPAQGKGAMLVVNLAECLRQQVGPVGRILFLVGAWGAVFSSLLGVWQSVPYIFADFCGMWQRRDEPTPVATDSRAYRLYLYAIAIVPLLGLAVKFSRIQLLYAFIGAGFMPLLAVVLLFLNGKAKLVGMNNRNRVPTTLVLIATLVFFAAAGWLAILEKIHK
jgi:Mn2+/Fe2+ NRAMP family transporter